MRTLACLVLVALLPACGGGAGANPFASSTPNLEPPAAASAPGDKRTILPVHCAASACH